MEPLQLTSAAWLAAAACGFAGLLWAALRRRDLAPAPAPPFAAEPLIRRLELRMGAIENLQSALTARLDGLGAEDTAERRLQGMAAQILRLVRDKDASLETALAGLDQLRSRLRVLEQLGDLAEARALLERFGARLDAVAAAAAGDRAAAEARLAPLEAKLGALAAELAASDPQAERFAGRLEAVRTAQEAATAMLVDRLEALGGRVAGLEAAAPSEGQTLDWPASLAAGRDAALETAVAARFAPLEARLAELERAVAGEGAVEAAAETARADAQAIGAQLVALRAAAEEARLFASRIGLLEASLPRLPMAPALMRETLERQAVVPSPPADPDAVHAAAPLSPGAPREATPRVVSAHKT